MSAPLTLDAGARRAFDQLAADLKRVFTDRFVALVAHGTGTGTAFAETITADDLDACSALVEAWHRDGLAAPLLLTPDEFRRSLDAFPVEYQSIVDRHVVIAGRPPFDDVAIAADDLRRACEVQARSHLIHLREGWVNAGGHGHALADLVEASAGPLRALLTNIARLHGDQASTAAELAALAHAGAGMPVDLVTAVLMLETRPENRRDVVGRMREYLEASERLWASVDRWRES
jgi:hypothetical protein